LEVAHGLARTMALAGTRWGDDLFEQKEFDEQMLVTKDLLERLEDQAVEVSDVYEQAYGNIRHLRTDLRWEAEGSALSYAERLHPSPAVGGYPRTVALDFISNEEGYSRSLYTGYLGLDDPMSASSLFVNLRCMQLFRGLVLTYAGGGINADSRPEIEWEEIHRKVETLISAWKYA
jgi:isochorismate synthase